MRRRTARFGIVAALALVWTTASAVAQPFPAPGTGVFTWERVGDRPLNATGFSFAPGGRLVVADDSVWAFEPDPAGPPAGRWVGLGRPGGVLKAVLALDSAADTLLVGIAGRTSRSMDGGATWAVVNGGVTGQSGGPDAPDGFAVVPARHPDAGRLLAGGVILFSDDRGATWPDAGQDIPLNQQSFAQTFAILPSDRVLAGTRSGVTASDNGGVSYARTPLWGVAWVDTLSPLATPGSVQTGGPSCGLADGSLCDGAVALGFSSLLPNIRAWRTNDGGRTWSESVALPQPEDGVGVSRVAGVVALGVGPDGLGRAVAVLGRGVVYATRDGGQTWQVVGRMPVRLGGASHLAWFARLGPDGHLWVSTFWLDSAEEWMYRSAEPASAAFPVAGEPSPFEAPGEVGLSVRPNPSGVRVEVVVSLAEAQTVRVVVLDALGREVAVVLDGPAGAGERAVAVDTASWPPGLYLVRAEASGHVVTSRLVVAR